MIQAAEYSISNMKSRPQFSAIIAQRIWRAWWQPKDYTQEFIQELVNENLTSNTLPTALVAHRGEIFLRTISLINNDMECRPEYTPWVAALWIEEDCRRQGIGDALLSAVCDTAAQNGFRDIYLCATADKHHYYSSRSWQLLEEEIDGLNIYQRKLTSVFSP